MARIKRHAGVLGLSSLLTVAPYDVPEWMPELLLQLVKHVNDPSPIQTTIKKTFAEFWRTHSDTWHIHRHKFTSDQLTDINQVISSPTYYA